MDVFVELPQNDGINGDVCGIAFHRMICPTLGGMINHEDELIMAMVELDQPKMKLHKKSEIGMIHLKTYF
jgi:hypothetical protein